MRSRLTRQALTAALVFSGLQLASAGSLTIVSFGGANQEAQAKAFYTPFQSASGTQVIPADYNGDIAQVKQAKDTHVPAWDIVEVESPELLRGCEEGLYEKLSWSRLGNASSFVPGAVSHCGAGIFVWSTVMAVKNQGVQPSSWSEFWDVSKFPGKRGLRKGAKYNLEFALMADGVKPTDVYRLLPTPEGQNRAFKKLQQLRPYIQWWEAGDQPQQWLQSGQVVASTAYNGRVSLARRKGSPLKTVWRDSIYDFDSWAIIKGSPNKDAALKFIEASLKPGRQAAFAEMMTYGPTQYDAVSLVNKKIQGDLPTSPENMVQGIPLDVVFWALYGDKLEKRFSSWLAGK
ncbi:ABC transporter substrate-binding protein [Leeia oryzae]|uniref:ABC transporter substrate-binding protein n=1 Tax=Leeia oryzae TaxID=356662 RepID=UPI000526D7CC|nr:ABC transporter substrate-binding protein [Leeia oryzae]